MADLEQRVAILEARNEKVLQLLQQAVSALFTQRQRIDELEGRLKAHTLLTGSVLQMAQRSDPEGYATILAMLERAESDLDRSEEDEAVVRELREVLHALRARSGAGR
jgi:hypothetical protein